MSWEAEEEKEEEVKHLLEERGAMLVMTGAGPFLDMIGDIPNSLLKALPILSAISKRAVRKSPLLAMTILGSTRELYISVQILYTKVCLAEVSVKELVALPKLTP